MVKTKPTILLSDAFSDWLDDKGIFSEMENMPWSEDVSAELLDMDYFGNHSGMKKCSPLLYALMEDDYTISDANRLKLANLVTSRFLPNWEALWRTYHLTYNPITDYSITESGSSSGTTSGTRGTMSSGTNTGTDDTSFVHGESIAKTDAVMGTEDSSHYGFNSSTASPVDSRANSYSETASETHTGTDQNNRTLNLANSASESETTSGTKGDSYSKTRSGLTGAKSIQELIRTERELWIEDFFTRVYSDIDSVLASLIYNREHKVNPYYLIGFGYYQI